jgi:hypothetical protein
MNNDCVEVEELLLELAAVRTITRTWHPKSFYGSLNQLGSLPIAARPRARCVASGLCSATTPTNNQKDTSAIAPES